MRHLLRIILIALAGNAFSVETLAPQKTIGINPTYRNLTVKPGDDFEEYANGGWRKTAEIPADRSSSGAGSEVFQRAEQRTAELVREIAAGHPEPGTPREMIANYYAAFMDTANIEKRGLEPLQEKLREIEKIESKSDLAHVLGKHLRADVDPLNATYFRSLALILVGANRLDEAEEAVRKALELQPSAANYNYTLTVIETRRGRAHEALIAAQAVPPGYLHNAALALALDSPLFLAHKRPHL